MKIRDILGVPDILRAIETKPRDQKSKSQRVALANFISKGKE